ncbi:MAG: ketose-bisphosphate aldolase [Propionibacteriaceae bacterium]|jgi:fructose-bisphosphate aldolase class II|nr:ketose-bisphosphate aldolase [Propionibacteriaceae bacterium]
MLTNGDGVLKVANESGFAVPAFNISDYAMFEGIANLCEDMKAPWIVAIHPDEYAHIGPDLMPAIVARANRSSVPMAIHLDHGGTYAQVLTAIQNGHTSVMIDASVQPFAENVALTRKVVEAAHAVGLSVEGELGTIGANDSYGESGAAEVIYTTPQDAARFVELTGVDSLAIAIGTFHGLYPAGMEPELKLDLLKQIKAVVPIPLVLHGGSNNPDDEIGIAARTGINKINISSDIKVAYHQKMREVLGDDPKLREPLMIQPACVAAMNEVAAHKIELFGASGRADLYR